MTRVVCYVSDLYPFDLSRLLDYAEGRCSSEERAAIAEWIAEAPERGALVQRLQAVRQWRVEWEGRMVDEPWVNSIAARVLGAIEPGQTPQVVRISPTPPELRTQDGPNESKGFLQARDSVIGQQWLPRGLGHGLVRWGLRERNFGKQSLRPWSIYAGVTAAVLLIVGLVMHDAARSSHRTHQWRTTSGKRMAVSLANGSTIILAPSTAVTISDSGADVSGQAMFAIVPNPSQPFVVRTQNALVRVLGTRFAVRQYPSESSSHIVVDDGRVALQARHPRGGTKAGEAVLTASMAAVVMDSGVTVTSGIATREYIGWTQGTLVFHRTPLRDVIVELSRTYGVEIRIADSSLAAERIIAEVDVRQKSVLDVLEFIGAAMNAHYIRDHSVFILSPGRREGNRPHDQMQRSHFLQPERVYGR